MTAPTAADVLADPDPTLDYAERWKRTNRGMYDPAGLLAGSLPADVVERALREASVAMVTRLYQSCRHDFEGHDLEAIERYLVRRWKRLAVARMRR